MIFSSNVFLFIFLPIVLVGYFLINPKLKNSWLLLSSLVFYAWGEPKYIILLTCLTIINWILGILIGFVKSRYFKTGFLTLCIVINLGILFFFKYLGFFASVVDTAFGTSIMVLHPSLSTIAMPIGISFFTFQIMSYVIDVYKNAVPPQKNLFDLGLYIMLFPQMIAGPIVRYSDIAEEINNRNTTIEDVYYGVSRFMIGFAKKVLLSNKMAVLADTAFGASSPSCTIAWLGIIGYTLQIYFDFSAYSDMAIGLGRIFGFHFLENFNYPYIATSIQDFWRRWHISLSSWFRDYLYIPLGGNRKGKIRTYINLFIIFFTTGLWHGASWNFIVWGLYHGIWQCVERIPTVKKMLTKLPKVFCHMYTLMIVMIGWVFFRADTLETAMTYLKHMFMFSDFSINDLLINGKPEMIVFFFFALLFCTPIYPKVVCYIDNKKQNMCKILMDCIIVMIFAASVLYLIGSGFNPFIYFRF